MATPIGFAAHIAPALAPVLTDWPQLRLTLSTDDRLIDLIDARIDIALRAGDLEDSARIGRKLCDFDRVVCASPSYLERRGVPAVTNDLAGHDWLDLAIASETTFAEAEPLMLQLMGPAGKTEQLGVPVRIVATTMIALQHLCEQGMGLAVLPYPDVVPSLERGILVRLFPSWKLPAIPVTLVTQRHDGEPAKVRVTISALQKHFAALPRTN